MYEAIKKRRAWIAAIILFLFGPVIGMLYLNRAKIALLYLIAFTAVSAAASYLGHPLGYLSISVVFGVIGAIHGLYVLRGRDETEALHWYARWVVPPIVLLGCLFVLLLVSRTFFFAPFSTPSVSNEPTLLVGDYFLSNKSSYGYSRQFLPFDMAKFSGRIFGAEPVRGDMVVFKDPDKTSLDYMRDYVKRVVGIPGDRIQMKLGVLIINGSPVPRVHVADYVEADGLGGNLRRVPQYRETLPNGRSYLTLDRFDSVSDNTDVVIVPRDQYFVIGDNRDNSYDSRNGMGCVPYENLVGRAVVRYFSADSLKVRTDRIFTSIE